MAMQIDTGFIRGTISDVYETIKGLGYEFDIVVQEVDLNTGTTTDFTTKGLWVSHDTVTINEHVSLQVQNSPTVYVKFENLMDGTNYIVPKFNQRIKRIDVIDFDLDRTGEEVVYESKVYSIQSINRVFNLWILRLKL